MYPILLLHLPPQQTEHTACNQTASLHPQHFSPALCHSLHIAAEKGKIKYSVIDWILKLQGRHWEHGVQL